MLPPVTYATFLKAVRRRGLTLQQLRGDVRPTEDTLYLMDALGLDRYERFVLRFERETAPGARPVRRDR